MTSLNGQALHRKRAAVLLYSYYPADPRPRRAAEALAEAGMNVDVLCLSENPSEARFEIINGVSVRRIALSRCRDSKWAYLKQYALFTLYAFLFLLQKSGRRPFDLVHVHNMPDAMVFAAILEKCRGAKVVLDLHDPMPELMMTTYGLSPQHWFVRVLGWLEKWSVRFADLVLTPNLAFKRLFVGRSCASAKLKIVMNAPEAAVFCPLKCGSSNNQWRGRPFRIMYHGSILQRHGLDLLVRAVALVRKTLPEACLEIFGAPTPFLKTCLSLAADLGIAENVRYHGPKSHSEIAQAIADCDLGVIPNRSSVFTRLNFPTRIFEVLEMHRPVIAPATPGIRDYFSSRDLLMFTPGDIESMASQILWVARNPAEAEQVVRRGLIVASRHRWRGEKQKLVAAVAELLGLGFLY